MDRLTTKHTATNSVEKVTHLELQYDNNDTILCHHENKLTILVD